MWEWGVSEKTSGEAFWGTCSAAAREESRAEALQQALHDGVAVAAALAALEAAGVRGTAGEAPARGRRAVGRLRGDAWVPARSKGEVGVGRGGGGGAARFSGAGSRGAGRKEKGGLFAISKNSKDLNVKQG